MKNSYFLFIFISFFSFAQGGMNMGGGMGGQRPSGPPPGNRLEQKDSRDNKMSIDEQLSFLKENLNLDELQELLIREELIDEEKKKSTSFNTNLSPEALQEKAEAEKKKREEKFKKILSEEQFQKWKELGFDFQKGNKHPKQNVMNIFRENSQDLNLTEEQQIKIEGFTNPEKQTSKNLLILKRKKKNLKNS